MKIKALTRFNNKDPEETFDASKEDATKWIRMGLAEEVKKKKEKPPKDKMVKDAPKTK